MRFFFFPYPEQLSNVYCTTMILYNLFETNKLSILNPEYIATDGDSDIPECAVGRHCCRQPDGTSGDMAVQARSQQSHELLHSTHGLSR